MIYLDYSDARPSGAAIRAKADGVIRYITDPHSVHQKHITRDEYIDLIHAGVDVLLVYENNTQDMQGGYSAGVANMRRALEGAYWIGYPDHKPIFLCADRHATLAENAQHWPAWRSYLDGGAAVIGRERLGAYGFSEAMDSAAGHAAFFWECGSRHAVRSFANFYQRNDGTMRVGGADCDINDVIHPIGSVTTQHKEDDMSYNQWPDADKKAIVQDIVAAVVPAATEAVAKRVMHWGLPNPADPKGGERFFQEYPQYAEARIVGRLSPQLAALQAAVAGIAKNPGITVEQLDQMINDAVAEHAKVPAPAEADAPAAAPAGQTAPSTAAPSASATA